MFPPPIRHFCRLCTMFFLHEPIKTAPASADEQKCIALRFRVTGANQSTVLKILHSLFLHLGIFIVNLVAGSFGLSSAYSRIKSRSTMVIEEKDDLVCFFDCDDCLYFNHWKTAKMLTAKIESYCVENLKLKPGKAYELYQQHGTCLRGLLEENIIEHSDVDHFLEAVHDVPLDDIQPDPTLRSMLLQINRPRWVFTASVNLRYCCKTLKNNNVLCVTASTTTFK